MIDPAMDGGGLKDSENAPNSFFPKINRTVFWRLGTDMGSVRKHKGSVGKRNGKHVEGVWKHIST